MARKVRYVLLCRHAPHQDGVLTTDEKTGRYPTQDVAARLSEELLFGRQVKLARLLYAPTPEARGTAWLLRKHLGVTPPQPVSSTPAEKQLDLARRALRQLGEVLTDQSPRATMTGSQPDQEASGQSSKVGQLLASDEFEIHPPAWAADQRLKKQVVRYEECTALSPARPRTRKSAECSTAAVTDVLTELPAGEGVLVVGHMPQVSWLAYELTRGRSGRWWKPWDRAPLPLASGEVACLALTQQLGRWSGHLQWAITPEDDDALKTLYEKIKGKMESAKQLAAVITLVLSGLLAVLLDTSKWNGLGDVQANLPGPFAYSGKGAVQATFGLLLAALALYLMTMYAYDRLLMPTRFWAELPPRRGNRPRGGSWLPRRPPSSSAWVVYRNMMRTWYTLFTAATALVALALAILGAALLRLDESDLRWGALAIAALLAIRWIFRPVLGSED